MAIVFVSHKFDEVYQIADQVSVLRDGRHVGTRPLAGLPRAELDRDDDRSASGDGFVWHAGRWTERGEVLRLRGYTRRAGRTE